MNEGIHPIASRLAAVARFISGVQVQWAGCEPSVRQRIYFANHTSHLDFVVLWSALPPEIRARTRPIAAKDYWEETPLRRYLAANVFKAVLVERGLTSKAKNLDEGRFAGAVPDRRNGRSTGRRAFADSVSRGNARLRGKKWKRFAEDSFIWRCGARTSNWSLPTWKI